MISSNNDIFSLYYKKYYNYVFKMLYTKIHTIEDAEDITQELFITMLNNIHRINDVKKWLNSAINYASRSFFKENSKTYCFDLIEDLDFSIEAQPITNDIVLQEALTKANCNEVELNMLCLAGMYNTKRTAIANMLGLSRRQVNYKYEQLKLKLVYHFKTMGISSIRDFVG